MRSATPRRGAISTTSPPLPNEPKWLRLDTSFPPWPLWLGSIAFWSLFTAVALWSTADARARAGDAPQLARDFAAVLAGTATWALSMPAIIWFSARRLLERDRWPRQALVILGVCVLWLVAAAVVVSWPRALLAGVGYRAQLLRYVNEGRAGFLLELSSLVLYAGLGQAIGFWDRSRRREAELRVAIAEQAAMSHAVLEARLANLRMRLQPHFVFNALNSVATLVRRGDSQQAIAMIVGFADLLRLALREDDPPDHALERELDLIRRYLDVEQLRYGSRLRVEIEADASAREWPVPALLLQPLVENAVRHGIAETSGEATLTVTARASAHALTIELANDGPPLPVDFDRSKATGLGLALTARRLALLHAGADALTLHSTPRGVLVRVTIPSHPADRHDR